MLSSIHDPRYQVLRLGLKRIRKDAGLTQIHLADRLGVGQSYVSKVERGETYVDTLLLVDWCAACGTAPVALVQKVSEFKSPVKKVLGSR